MEKREEWIEARVRAAVPKPGKRLDQIAAAGPDDPSEILKWRYLCRGGGMLLVGPTGIGKSSFSMQAMLLWALGRQAFGIYPALEIESLLVQAENDEGDIAEMRDGILKGLGLVDGEAEAAMRRVHVIREDSRTGNLFFLEVLQPAIEAYRPDLVWIDPALAYLGGEANSQKDVGGFLRNNLNPLLRRLECGCVIVHHTNKPPREKGRVVWSGGDFAYLAGGSAEWANWARSVIVLRSMGSNQVFEMRAAKRGQRLRWRERDGGEAKFTRILRHSRIEGEISWEELPEEEAEALQGSREAKRKGASKEDLLCRAKLCRGQRETIYLESRGLGNKGQLVCRSPGRHQAG